MNDCDQSSYSKASSIRDDLEGAINKLSELLEQDIQAYNESNPNSIVEKDCKISNLTDDFELSATVSDQNTFGKTHFLSSYSKSKSMTKFHRKQETKASYEYNDNYISDLSPHTPNENVNPFKRLDFQNTPMSCNQTTPLSQNSNKVLRDSTNTMHRQTPSQYSGIKNCTSMKEIMKELSKIVEGSNTKKDSPLSLSSPSQGNKKLIFQSDSSPSNPNTNSIVNLSLKSRNLELNSNMSKTQSVKSFSNDIFLDIQKIIDQTSSNGTSHNSRERMQKLTQNKKFEEVIKRIYKRENDLKEKLNSLRMEKMYKEAKNIQAKPKISKRSQQIIERKYK